MLDTKIADRQGYNAKMRKALMDKLFFLDKIDVDVIVDFGTADGALVEFVNRNFPDTIAYGYDISEEELEIAKQNVDAHLLFSDWGKLIAHLRQEHGGQKIAIVANSVIHEVYAYGDKESIAEFWDRVSDPIFDYVVVRDMALSIDAIFRQSFSIHRNKIYSFGDREAIAAFENHWGSLDSNHNLIHFLLKYKYVANWDRELAENYLPLSAQLMTSMVAKGRELVYHDHFVLPYLHQQVKNDFDIDLQDATHMKIIAKTAK